MWAFRNGLQDQKTQQSVFWSLLIIFCFYLYYPPGCMLSHPVMFDLRPQELWPARSSVHGVIPARTLQWVAISSSRASSWPRNWTCISCVSWIGRQILTTEPLGKPVWSTFMDVMCPNRAFLFPTQMHTLSFTQSNEMAPQWFSQPISHKARGHP